MGLDNAGRSWASWDEFIGGEREGICYCVAGAIAKTGAVEVHWVVFVRF